MSESSELVRTTSVARLDAGPRQQPKAAAMETCSRMTSPYFQRLTSRAPEGCLQNFPIVRSRFAHRPQDKFTESFTQWMKSHPLPLKDLRYQCWPKHCVNLSTPDASHHAGLRRRGRSYKPNSQINCHWRRLPKEWACIRCIFRAPSAGITAALLANWCASFGSHSRATNFHRPTCLSLR